jgi:hypothetical protein
MKINNTYFPVEFTFRAWQEFERLTGKQPDQVTGISDVATLIYCAVKNGARRNHLTFNLTLDEFFDYLDEHTDAIAEAMADIQKSKFAPEPESEKKTS